MKKPEFSFVDQAEGNFEDHIESHVPDFAGLRRGIVALAPTLVQPDTTVLDVGCSSGVLLRLVRDEVQKRRSGTFAYRGIDIVPEFQSSWERVAAPNLSFEVADACDEAHANLSLAISVFTAQFVPFHRRKSLLRSLLNGLVDGGHLIIAEKLLASSVRYQDALTFKYYDFKRDRGIPADEILDKERSLRGFMSSYTRDELIGVLKEVGFRDIQEFWCQFPFVGFIASK